MNKPQAENSKVTLDDIVDASGEDIFACLPDLEATVAFHARGVLFDGRKLVESSHAVRVAFSLLFVADRLLSGLRPVMWNKPDSYDVSKGLPCLLSEDDFTKLARLAYRTGRKQKGCCCAPMDSPAVAADVAAIAAALEVAPTSAQSKRARGKLRRG